MKNKLLLLLLLLLFVKVNCKNHSSNENLVSISASNEVAHEDIEMKFSMPSESASEDLVDKTQLEYDKENFSAEIYQSMLCLEISTGHDYSCQGEMIESLYASYYDKYMNDFRYEIILARIYPTKHRESTIHMMFSFTWDDDSFYFVRDNFEQLNLTTSEVFFLYVFFRDTDPYSDIVTKLENNSVNLYDGSDRLEIENKAVKYIDASLYEKRQILSSIML